MGLDHQVVFLPGVGGHGSFWHPVAQLIEPASASFVDWPGLGGNPGDDEVGGFDDLVALVLRELSRPSVLVAQSMGGVVAVMTALRQPQLVTHLVLVATSNGIDVGALGAVDWRPTTQLAAPDNPTWVYDSAPDLSAVLVSLLVPTLLVWATDDPISPLAVGRALADRLPNARLVTIESSDHAFAMTTPRPVAESIIAFLSRT